MKNEKKSIQSVFDFTRCAESKIFFHFHPQKIVKYSGLHISFAIDIYIANSIFKAHTIVYPHKNHIIYLCKWGIFVCASRVCTWCIHNIANAMRTNESQIYFIQFSFILCRVRYGPIVCSSNTDIIFIFIAMMASQQIARDKEQQKQISNLFHSVFICLVKHFECIHL